MGHGQAQFRMRASTSRKEHDDVVGLMHALGLVVRHIGDALGALAPDVAVHTPIVGDGMARGDQEIA